MKDPFPWMSRTPRANGKSPQVPPPPSRPDDEDPHVEKVKGLEVKDIRMKLDDMGGNEDLKEQILRLVSQYRHPEFFRERGVKLPKGILLYGPPGTGKTLAAKIMAGEIGYKFYHVKASDILSKWYGESEKIVKAIFENVEPPCIVFIDEIDSVGSHRDGGSEQAKRVLTEILQQVDGMAGHRDILLLAATNRKEDLDSALLRPGRFDRHILVDLPDENARRQIWAIYLAKGRKSSSVKLFHEEIDIHELVKASDGLSGADIEEIFRRTAEKITFESFESGEEKLISTKTLLNELGSYIKERKAEAERQKKKIGFG